MQTSNKPEDSLFEQMSNISEAHAYDIVAPSLQEENEKLKERVKYLEDLIMEYTTKMKNNLTT